jgi:ferredoxin
VNIRIEPGICQGTGFCERIAPSVFALAGAQGPPFVRPDAAGDIERLAVEAEMACPIGAISLEENESAPPGQSGPWAVGSGKERMWRLQIGT